MGLESAYSARALRDLAHRLALSGWAALRVDYAGTGDSAGTWTDPGLVEEWLRGVRGAIDHVKALGAPRVAVIGLRLGATLAAAELARGGRRGRSGPVGPVCHGQGVPPRTACVVGLRAGRDRRRGARARRGRARAVWSRTGGSRHPASCSPERPSRNSSRSPSPRATGAWPPESSCWPDRAGGSSASWRSAGTCPMLTSPRSADRTISSRTWPSPQSRRWSGSSPGSPNPAARGQARRSGTDRPWRSHRTEGRPGVLERPVQLGPAHLFGILSEPEEQAGSTRPRPSSSSTSDGSLTQGRHGSGWTWPGRGRSGWPSVPPGGSERAGRQPHEAGANRVGRVPRRRARGSGRHPCGRGRLAGADLIFVGLCSGADHAIEAALHGPISSICVVNPALAYVRWGSHRYRRFEPNPEASAGTSDRQSWGSTRSLLRG